jgi:hypothetical protein
MQVKVTAKKKEGWDEDINIQFPYRSPGVGASSSVNLPKGQTEVFYPINASGNAEIKNWRMFVLGTAGGMWASSQLATLQVADAYARFELQRAACEQGQEALVLCKINHTTPFEGEAKAELVGIPPKVTVEPLTFTKDTTELTFTLKTQADSPIGKHSLFCQITIPQNGESIVSRAGNVELQIDKPLPPEPNQPPPPPANVAAQPAPTPAQPAEQPKAKPLTRLEKLRLSAKQRQEAKQNQP